MCLEWTGPDENLIRDDCYLPPDYVKDILAFGPHRDHAKNMPLMPIVLIEDGQRPEVYENLRADPGNGSRLVGARDLQATLENSMSTAAEEGSWLLHQSLNDMMIAIGSEVFIGARVSSMAVVIGG